MTGPEIKLTRLQSLQKRALDLVLSVFVLLLLLPVMMMIALAIKFGSPGPVIYRRRRYAPDGREIVVYRFRTMRVTEDGYAIVAQAARADNRLTPLGSLLRRSGLDELPSLVNVVRGDMSMVGPRPKAVGELERYQGLADTVLHAKPGITFTSRGRDYSSTATMDLLFEEEKSYLKHWSIWVDLAALGRTTIAIFRSENAY